MCILALFEYVHIGPKYVKYNNIIMLNMKKYLIKVNRCT